MTSQDRPLAWATRRPTNSPGLFVVEPSSKAWEAFVLPLDYTRAWPILRQVDGIEGQRKDHVPRARIHPTSTLRHFEVIEVTINGRARSFAAPLNVSGLLYQLGLAGKRIALERNGEIVPRSQFDALELADGDALEIVVAVGGG